MPLAAGLQLWYSFNLHLLLALGQTPFIVSHYDSFFVRPEAELRRAAAFVALAPHQEQFMATLQVISENLRHHRAASATEEIVLPNNVKLLYQALCEQAQTSAEGDRLRIIEQARIASVAPVMPCPTIGCDTPQGSGTTNWQVDAPTCKSKGILFISHDASRTGAPIFLLSFLRWLRMHSRCQFRILLRSAGPLEREFRELGETHVAGDTKLDEHFFADVGLIYSNTCTNGLFLKSQPCREIPILTHMHELNEVMERFGAENLAAVKDQTTHFVACSEAVAASLRARHGIPAASISVHYSGVSAASVWQRAQAGPLDRNGLRLDPESFLIAGCGFVDWRKGPDLFLQLAASLRRKLSTRKRIEFVWIGFVPPDERASILRGDLERLGLSNEVRFLGEQANPYPWLNACDLFCLPSREDPFPLVMLEAAALGKPLVCFAGSGGAGEFCERGGGFATPYLDIEALSQQCLALIDNPALLRQTGETAKRLTRELFDIDVIAPALLRTLESVAAQTIPERRQCRQARQLSQVGIVEVMPAQCDFDESCYLATHQDVAIAVAGGQFESGWQHFVQFGFAEKRCWFRTRVPPSETASRALVLAAAEGEGQDALPCGSQEAPGSGTVGGPDDVVDAIFKSEFPSQSEFEETRYLAAHPDVADTVRTGGFKSGWEHFQDFGFAEERLWFRKRIRSTAEEGGAEPEPIACGGFTGSVCTACVNAAQRWGVSPKIHPEDMIFRYLMSRPEHYFNDGATSAQKLRAILAEDCHVEVNGGNLRLLEFASGYGRVTRHLKKSMPLRDLVACDIHPQAIRFIESLGVKAVQSASRPEDLHFDNGFDVVFALSFFSHMPKNTFGRWLRTLAAAVVPGGFLIFTTHGLLSQKRIPKCAFDDEGFYFGPMSEQKDLSTAEYGVTVVKPQFVYDQIAGLPDLALQVFREGFWWEHQDTYIVRKQPAAGSIAQIERASLAPVLDRDGPNPPCDTTQHTELANRKDNLVGKVSSINNNSPHQTTVITPMKLPPPELLQRIANNPSQEDFERSFGPLRHQVIRDLIESGIDFRKCAKILDLGCGVGRFLYAFREHVSPEQKLYGCDVFEMCAKWCTDNIDWAQVVHNKIDQPLPFPDNEFDLLYALSVFTHFNLEMQFKWAHEVYRALRSGGHFFGTFHGVGFFPMFLNDMAKAKEKELFSLGSDGLFAFLSYYPSPDGLNQGQVNVASAQNEYFIRQQFSAFEIVLHKPASGLAGGQDLWVLRKPTHGRPIVKPHDLRKDNPSGKTSLRFFLDGHKEIKFLLCAGPPRLGGCNIQFEVFLNGTLFNETQKVVSGSRVFGSTHLIEHAITIAGGLSGEIEIRIGIVPGGGPADGTWLEVRQSYAT